MKIDKNNPWVGGIIGGVIGAVISGIILYYSFEHKKRKSDTLL